MWRRLIEILRVIFISPEILFLLAILCLTVYFPSLVIFIGIRILGNGKLWDLIYVFPFALLAYAFRLAFQLHAPVEAANRELYDWEQYWTLKLRILVTLFWAAIACFLSLMIWFGGNDISPQWVGQLFIAATGISLIETASGILALFVLKEILAK